jgi:hypothetical protein
MDAYTPDDLMKRIAADLRKWRPAGVTPEVQVAKDPWHVLEILTDSPLGLRLVLHWAGEDALGDEDAAPLATQKIEVIVGYSLGLKATPEGTLIDGTSARPSLLKFVSDVRQRVLELEFEPGASSGLVRYGGCEPFETPEGVPLAAYRLRFGLDTSLPDLRQREV